MPDLISKSTRNEFREALVGSVLRHIETIFDAAGLVQDANHEPQTSGARRSLVERYYAAVDFGLRADVEKVLSAYSEVILWLRKEGRDRDADDLLMRMEHDGYGYDTGVFVPTAWPETPFVEIIRKVAITRDLPQLLKQADRINQSVEDDPGLAVGTAKELVETVCKTILEEKGVEANSLDLGRLTRSVAQELRLHPDGIESDAKGAETIRRVLSNLGQISQGIAELRNLYGTGHGRSGRTGGVRPRHARLAVGAATTLAVFLLETHIEQV